MPHSKPDRHLAYHCLFYAAVNIVESANTIQTPVSVGELIDKISILEIKAERIEDAAKRANVARELAGLMAVAAPLLAAHAGLEDLKRELRAVNQRMWEIQDGLRAHEAAQDFGTEFIALARGVYQTNGERVALKGEINRLLGSKLVEEKQYA